MDREEKVRFGFPGKEKDATVKISDDDPRPWDVDTKFRYVGKKTQRVDGLAKASGRAKYTYDVNLPGLLHARFLPATVAAGTIRVLDFDAARKLPGVKAVMEVKKRGDKILYAGQSVAVVCAESIDLCDDALRAITVLYDKSPHVVTADDAKAEGAPRVNAQRSNVGETRDQGASPEEIEEALKGAKAIVDATYRTQIQLHSALETHGAVAQWGKDASGNETLKVWCSTQGTFSVRQGLCDALKISASQVEVVCEYMGGGFGAKFGAGEEGLFAARLAKETGAPVKLMRTRKEEQLTTGNRPDSVQIVKAGASAEGKLVAWSVTNYGTGGYDARMSAGARNPMIYLPEGIKRRKSEFAVATNCGPSAAMRAPGHPQGSFAVEQVMDELAEKLGLDPIEFRLKNDSYPMRPAQYEIAKKEIGWERRNPKGGDGALAGKGPLKRGLGAGASTWGNNGNADGTAVTVVIAADGSVEARNGCQDIGTGTRTLLGLCVAEELGCPLDKIKVRLGHTTDPHGPGSGGSSTAPTLAPAAMEAGHAAKLAFLEKIAPKLGAEAAALSVRDEKIVSKEGKSWSWSDACKQLGVETVEVTSKRKANFREGFNQAVGGVQLAEVEVDVGTGVVRVIKVVAVHDAGTIVNRLTFESQMLGGVIQGLSYALFEDRVMDKKSGLMLNANLETYKIAGATDMPEIVCIPFDIANGYNSAGVAGLGEPTVIPTAGAIANAIANATGVRVRELPITPDKVLAALGTKGGAR